MHNEHISGISITIGGTSYMELDTSSSMGMQSHPIPIYPTQEVSHVPEEYEFLPRQLSHAGFQVNQLHSQ